MGAIGLESGLNNALKPEALKRDGIRLGILVAGSLLSLLLSFPHALKIMLAIGDGFGVFITAIALFIAIRAAMRKVPGAQRALATYGLLCAALIISFVVVI